MLTFSFEYFLSVWPKLLEAVPAGQTEAAIVFGLSPWRRVMHIILPQALPIMLPGLVNQIIEIIKETPWPWLRSKSICNRRQAACCAEGVSSVII